MDLWLFALVMGFGPLFFLFLCKLYCFGHHRLPCGGCWWLLGLKLSWLCFAPVPVADWVGAGPVRIDGWWGGGAAVVLVWVAGGVCNRVLFTGVWSAFRFLFVFRDWVVIDFWPFMPWYGFINPKGYGSFNSKGYGSLTRKGLVSNLLDSSLDLSSYAYD
jgi:hypothetical protein